MLSMWKSSAIVLLLSSSIVSANSELKGFLLNSLKKNPNVVKIDAKILSHSKVKELSGWESYIVELKGSAKFNGKIRDIKQQNIYFVKDGYVTTDLINMKTGENLKDKVGPDFKAEFYKKENLISGDEHSKHKVAIFSDPLCPFCRKFTPGAIEYMKKYPETFAIYYYHFPLPALHPASVAITKAAIVAHKQGVKNVEHDIYSIDINPRESDEKKILAAVNKKLGTKISVDDIHRRDVEAHFKADQDVVEAMVVRGTPTVFFDGKKDPGKNKYKTIKVK